MSLYNTLFGTDPYSEFLCETLKIDVYEDDQIREKVSEMKRLIVEQTDTYSEVPFPPAYIGEKYLELLDELKGKVFPSGRFRDCCSTETNGNHRIHLYTRCGGGNAQEYSYVYHLLEYHPNFECYEYDSFDSTYATFIFTLPQLLVDALEIVKKEESNASSEFIE